MKKTLIIITLFFAFSNANSQTLPDGDLNNWTLHSYSGGTYYEPINGWLMTLNKLADVPYPIGPGPVTTERVSDSYQGAYAAKMTSKEFIVGVNHLFIPGVVGTVNVDILAQIAKVGRPYTYPEKPRRFKGYFKYAPVNNDSCLMLVLLTKYNTSLHQRDTIAIARHAETATLTAYTPFDLEIEYRDTVTTPDTISLFLASSAFLNFANLQACHGQINSTMHVDELAFSMVNGIEMPVMPLVDVKIFPNPSMDKISISTSKQLITCTLEIYNSAGLKIKTLPFEGSDITLNVSGLNNGKYYYKLSAMRQVLNSGSFIVAR